MTKQSTTQLMTDDERHAALDKARAAVVAVRADMAVLGDHVARFNQPAGRALATAVRDVLAVLDKADERLAVAAVRSHRTHVGDEKYLGLDDAW